MSGLEREHKFVGQAEIDNEADAVVAVPLSSQSFLSWSERELGKECIELPLESRRVIGARSKLNGDALVAAQQLEPGRFSTNVERIHKGAQSIFRNVETGRQGSEEFRRQWFQAGDRL